jgi:hypothetical protein
MGQDCRMDKTSIIGKLLAYDPALKAAGVAHLLPAWREAALRTRNIELSCGDAGVTRLIGQ